MAMQSLANHRFSSCLPTARKSLCVVFSRKNNTICAKFVYKKRLKAFWLLFLEKVTTLYFVSNYPLNLTVAIPEITTLPS